jgi:hypothetical protein
MLFRESSLYYDEKTLLHEKVPLLAGLRKRNTYPCSPKTANNKSHSNFLENLEVQPETFHEGWVHSFPVVDQTLKCRFDFPTYKDFLNLRLPKIGISQFLFGQ